MSADRKSKNFANEILLENKMECLDINETDANPSNSQETECLEIEPPSKRVLRRRSMSMATDNRRVLTKPKKSCNTTIESIYLCKQVKRLPPTLETIYEEPKLTKNSEVLYIGLKKQKRVISFEESNKGKVKKRQLKAKKIFGKSFNKKKRATMEALLEKLKYVE